MPEALIEDQAMTYLADLAAHVPPTHAIVEVGVYQGANLVSMARAAHKGRGAHCWGVDAWGQGDVYQGRPHMVDRYTTSDYTICQQAIREARVVRCTTLITNTSVRAAAQWDGPNIGLLVIDGEHRYNSVINDYQAWRPHLADNAIIAFDDFGGTVGEQVQQAVNHLTTNGHLTIDNIIGTRLAICHEQT